MPESRDSSLGRPQAGPIRLATVKFGPFTLDLEGRKLRRGDEPIHLPSRALAALAYLIAHRDRLVDREEIIAAVWHDVAVTDDSLIHAVSVIRRALGDDPSHASFIETIPRRGYRFVGTIESVEPADPVPGVLPDVAVALSTASEPHVVSWPWRPAIAAALGIVGTHGLGEHVQGIHASGCNADKQLLCPDLDQYCALFGAERDVRHDLDCTSAGPSKILEPAHDPCRREHRRHRCADELCRRAERAGVQISNHGRQPRHRLREELLQLHSPAPRTDD